MPTTILFDLDDTLLDRRASIGAYARRFLGDFGPRLAEFSSDDVAAVMAQADGNGYHTRLAVSENLVAMLPWVDRPSVDVLVEHWLNCFSLHAQPRPHAFDLLQSLRSNGFTLGLVTNGSIKGRNIKIDASGLRSFFATIVISEAAGVEKPAPEIFDLALGQLGKTASEAWYVGDHPLNDIVGAAEAGLTPVWLRGMHAWPEEYPPPAHQVDGLDEVLHLLGAEET